MIVEDVIERPYITIGMTASATPDCRWPLTSTNSMMRRLGRRWQKLHRLIYVIAILGVWHFYWQVKQDILEPLIYALILAMSAVLPFTDPPAPAPGRQYRPYDKESSMKRIAHPR